MARLFHGDLLYFRQSCRSTILALFWISGLIAGAAAYFFAGHFLSSLMHGILSGSVSIVSLLCVTVLPFLFSAFAVYICEPRLLYPICFGKAFLFSVVSMAVWISFGSAGWLVRWLLMFSDLVSLPLLYLFWLRHISGQRSFSGLEILLVASACMLIGSVDYCCISPFVAML